MTDPNPVELVRSADPPARRARHLIDPSAPRPARDPRAEQRLVRVQRWVLSVLAVTTILHLSVGLVVGALFLEPSDRVGRIGLCVIAGAFGVAAVAVGRAIHGRSVVSPWLLLGVLPAALGLWLSLR